MLESPVRKADATRSTVTGATLLAGSENRFFFTLGSGATTELWQVSGQFATQVGGSLSAAVDDATGLDGNLIFRIGNVLYAADATSITQLNDFGSDTPDTLNLAGDQVIFLVDGNWYGTDGTVSGTIALTDVDSGEAEASDLFAVDGALYYFTGESGTLSLRRATPGEDDNFGAEVLTVNALAALTVTDWRILGAINSKLLFTVTSAAGTQLWVSEGRGDANADGESDGTYMIHSSLGGEASFVSVQEGRLFFSVLNSTDGTTSLWSSDGSNVAAETKVGIALAGAVDSHAVVHGETAVAGPDASQFFGS